MARKLRNKLNTTPPDGDFIYGRIKDKISGVQEGTPVNENCYGDIHQFFERLMDLAGATFNELPEQLYSGFQFNDALAALMALQMDIGDNIVLFGNCVGIDHWLGAGSGAGLNFYDNAITSTALPVNVQIDMFQFITAPGKTRNYLIKFDFIIHVTNSTGGTPYNYRNRFQIWDYTNNVDLGYVDIVETGVTSINETQRLSITKRFSNVAPGTTIGLRFVNLSATSLSGMSISGFTHSVHGK